MSQPAYVSHDVAALSVKERYFLLTACIVPRPIAFVTTLGRSGVLNGASYSFFNGVSSDPPLVMLGIAAKPSEAGLVLKDTARNIAETGEFVVNICNADMARWVEESGAPLPPEESEVERMGLTTIPSVKVRPPRLAVSPVHLECRLYESLQFGRSRASLILGEVLAVHAREDVLVEGRVDGAALDPLARMAAGRYARISDIFKVG